MAYICLFSVIFFEYLHVGDYCLCASSGTVFMPPKWSLGYQQCRWSYDSDTRVREVGFDVMHLCSQLVDHFSVSSYFFPHFFLSKYGKTTFNIFLLKCFVFALPLTFDGKTSIFFSFGCASFCRLQEHLGRRVFLVMSYGWTLITWMVFAVSHLIRHVCYLNSDFRLLHGQTPFCL